MSSLNGHFEEYLLAKPKIRILLLGSYANSALKSLEDLGDFLHRKDYAQATLVKDFKYPEKNESETFSSYNLRKSEYWLPWADVPVFVFFPKVDNSGVGYELKHLVDNLPDMMWRSIIAISTSKSLKMSSLLSGLAERWSSTSSLVYFSNQEKLEQGIRGTLTGLLDKLYFHVVKRDQGEWELSKEDNHT